MTLSLPGPAKASLFLSSGHSRSLSAALSLELCSYLSHSQASAFHVFHPGACLPPGASLSMLLNLRVALGPTLFGNQ